MEIKLFIISALILSVILATGCAPGKDAGLAADPKMFTDGISGIVPDENKVMRVDIVDEGYDIYAYTKEHGWGYRYGPTMLRYPDGSMDAWFAAPGRVEWDWFTYRHSDDGGQTWSDEIVALQPTADSMDFNSVCDPGVVYFNGWYYLGYTSTIYAEGICNNGFVARSKNPEGPYEKWNGSGWGGKPAPIVYYTGDKTGWGVGEMSFVVVDNTLYIYYTWNTGANTTRVSVADATEENWPLTMVYKGVAMRYKKGEDSADVKYVEDYGKFIAINTGDRMGPDSYLGIWESNDGLTFKKTNSLYTNVIYYCHNAGLMSRPDGHINLSDKQYLGYAYGGTSNKWGGWNTRVHEFKISLVDEVDPTEAEQKNNRKADAAHWPLKEPWTVGVTTDPHHYIRKIDSGEFDINVIWVDTLIEPHKIEKAKDVVFTGYDKKIIAFKGLKCKPLAVGETYVTVKYDGLQSTFLVTIKDESADLNENLPGIKAFQSCFMYPTNGPVAVSETGALTVSLSNTADKPQIRGYAVFDNGKWFELFNDTSEQAPYNAPYYKVDYSVGDISIIRVNQTGIVTAKGIGTTTVTVSCQGRSFSVEVHVVA